MSSIAVPGTEPARLSQTRGPAVPLIEKTTNEVLHETARRFPECDALVVRQQGVRLTWAALEAEVERTACGLAGLGLQPGDRAGVWASNCVEWILLHLACARAGIILVNVNPAYRSHELRYVLKKSRIRAIFLREKDARTNYAAILEESRNGDPMALEHVVWIGDRSWDEMLAHGVDVPAHTSVPEDVINIQYTSGTTGLPKGVMLTHRNLVNNGSVMAACLRMSSADRICAPVPLYHCFGSVIGTMVALVSGAALILPAPQFDARATLEAVHAERATSIYGVPTMFIAELEHPDFRSFDLTSLSKGVMAGSPCPIEVMRRVVNEMHCRNITIIYGQTESSPAITMSKVDDPLELRVTTVGCTLPNTEVKIVSTETGETLPMGETGELCTRGYLVMKGYDDDPEATAAAVDPEGWLHTGDLALMHENGYFSFRGRAKDTIIRGGENIYPREVEEYLHTHPKIADVHVVGLPDALLGETVLAWIQLRPGEEASVEEIRDYCRGKIAYFKVPQYIRFVDSFPMTVTRKVQKFLIREQEIRERGLDKVANIQTA
ncbi:MAG TPA: AMP-binding protein [Bryobacteraceae bacterium]|nr:AMP-binding protein [Bryobacteraceae bacterium]